MARERSRHHPAVRRGTAAPEQPDAIGRLDDVLATLEEMLDGQGVPPAGAPGLAARANPDRDPGGSGALPLLRDVVAPVADEHAEGTHGVAGALDGGDRVDSRPVFGGAEGTHGVVDSLVRPEPEKSAARIEERKPPSFGFEFVPDDPLPRIGDLALDPPLDRPAGDPGGGRYGDAPPLSLDPEVYRHLIDRLANEIDVIVRTGAEEAMQRAATDIAARVRVHVAIILPEIIEELVRMSGRSRD